jgi:hypothetical protein
MDVLQPLGCMLDRCHIERVLIAGDLFEDGVDPGIASDWLNWLRRRGATLVGVVPGNHDRRLRNGTEGMSVFPEGLSLGEWLVVHGDGPAGDPARETARATVLGHFHPSLHAAGKCWPCYLVGPRRLVLPAYSPDARGGGLATWAGYRCLVPAGPDVLDFGTVGQNKTGSRRGQARRLPG